MDPVASTLVPPSALAALLGLGAVWTWLHCGGMCGPLMVAFRFGAGAGSGGVRAGRAALQVACYQAGRAIPYAVAGAVAGAVGQGVVASLAGGARWLGVGLGVALVAAALLQLLRPGSGAGWTPAPRLVRRLLDAVPRHPWAASAGLGAVLAALPCGLAGWTLGLAALTGSPQGGALAMLALVAMSTPPLLLAACAGATLWGGGGAGRWRSHAARWLPPTALLVSAAWILRASLMTGAGCGCH